MKKFWKILLLIFAVPLVVIDLFLTIYLLNYNKYNVSQFGKYSFIIMDEKLDKFKKGDLLVVKKNENSEIKVGDYIFFYDIKLKENVVNYGKVNNVQQVNEQESTYTMNDNYLLSSDYIVGKAETSQAYGYLGAILSVLSSRLGFLFLIIFPILILFIYQMYLLFREFKNQKKGLE